MRYLLIGVVALASCSAPDEVPPQQQEEREETWTARLDLGGVPLTFTFEWQEEQILIVNGTEEISLKDVLVRNDSIFIDFPVFDSRIMAKLNEGAMEGSWFNYSKGDDYIVPFTASKGPGITDTDCPSPQDMGGKWQVWFHDDSGDTTDAIGQFDQNGNTLTGTFLTNTGDYRFLGGNVDCNKMELTCFDGSHAFLFRARLDDDGMLHGEFWSGNHWYENWTAVRNDTVELADPYDLTFLNEGYEKLEFEFPDLKGNMVSLANQQFKDRPVIIQILGSWCPNCVDETEYLAEYHRENREKAAIIGLCYERTTDVARASANIQRLVDHYGVEYPMLLAGKANKAAAAETLPMLNHIMSYPTTIFLDRDHKVVSIHTGFSGPATGIAFDIFKQEFEALVDSLSG